MIVISHYTSFLGDLLIAVKKDQLIGLWIENQKYYFANIKEEVKEDNQNEMIVRTKKWLDQYFKGNKMDIKDLELNPIGTDFQKSVWKILQNIPYGSVITYKEIALELARQKGIKRMSSQAVGNAVSHNPISIIIPCHRVIGSNRSLTGYAGGIDKKIKLLELEKIDITSFSIPKEK